MSHLLPKEWQRSLVIDQIFQYPKFSLWFVLIRLKLCQLKDPFKLLCWLHIANKLYKFSLLMHLSLTMTISWVDIQCKHKTCLIWLPVSVGCSFALSDISWDWTIESLRYLLSRMHTSFPFGKFTSQPQFLAHSSKKCALQKMEVFRGAFVFS